VAPPRVLVFQADRNSASFLPVASRATASDGSPHHTTNT